MFPPDIHDLAAQVIAAYAGRKIVTAESCTGGLLAGALTSVAGASAVFERGFVTYSNAAKTEMLGVPEDLLSQVGAVSAEVAEAMARGALERSGADVAVAITGIAGPDGGTAVKPVGLVYLGLAARDGAVFHVKYLFRGDRDAVRTQAVVEALRMVLAVEP